MRQSSDKSKFNDLDEEWRSEMLSADSEHVNKAIVKAAINMIVLDLAKKADTDLAALREQLKTASEQYSAGKKENTLRITFLIELLRSRGEDVPDIDAFLTKASKDVAEGNT